MDSIGGRAHQAGRHVVLIGNAGHPEIEGTLGHLLEGAATLVSSAEAVAQLAFDEEQPMAFAVQTTFSVGEARGVVAALASRYRLRTTELAVAEETVAFRKVPVG